MTKQSKATESAKPRPKPGPRPRTAEHGSVRRRTGAAETSIPFRRTVDESKVQRTLKKKKKPEKSPEELRVRRFRWWLLIAIASVAGLVAALLEAPYFEAQSVQISGHARTSEGLILESLDIPPDQALLLYDFSTAGAALSELPWVRDVAVTRQWPSTVRVVIEERAVVASVGRPDGREWLVIGDDGVLIERRLTPPAGVPLIVATHALADDAVIGERVAEASRALEVALNVPLQLDPWITTWTLDENGELTAELVGSAEANFGTVQDSRTQFVSLASILDGGAELTCLDRIDLSVADTPVLHRNPTCIVEASELG